MRCHFLGWMLCLLFSAPFTPTLLAAARARHFVVVVWDGMRPDYVSSELTPTLQTLRDKGVWFAEHHSAYPTSTEVNGAVLATGVFPKRNGIAANKEFRREIDPLNVYETQALRAVRRGDELTGGKYVAMPTLAEMLQARGFNTAVASAKGVGLLHDRRARGDDATGLVWFADGCLPESRLASLTNRFGPFPPAASPNVGRDEWATTNNDVIVASNGGSSLIYVPEHSPHLIERTVTNLQRQAFSGVIFTRDARLGTFALSEVMIDTATAPDIVVAMRWVAPAQENTHRISRIFSDGYNQYRAGMHVTLSPLDLRNLAVACGPDFRQGATDSLPSGNVDIVPTLLWLMNVAPIAPLDGRVLSEALTVPGPAVRRRKVRRREKRAEFADGVREQYLVFSELNGVRYLEEGNEHWNPRGGSPRRSAAREKP